MVSHVSMGCKQLTQCVFTYVKQQPMVFFPMVSQLC